MVCDGCDSASKKYVVDSSMSFGTEPEKKFPYWLLFFVPLLIPIIGKFK